MKSGSSWTEELEGSKLHYISYTHLAVGYLDPQNTIDSGSNNISSYIHINLIFTSMGSIDVVVGRSQISAHLQFKYLVV